MCRESLPGGLTPDHVRQMKAKMEQEDPDAFYYSMLGWSTFAVVATSWLVMMNVQAARAQT